MSELIAHALITLGFTAPTTDELRLLSLPLARPFHTNLVLTVITSREQRDFR